MRVPVGAALTLLGVKKGSDCRVQVEIGFPAPALPAAFAVEGDDTCIVPLQTRISYRNV